MTNKCKTMLNKITLLVVLLMVTSIQVFAQQTRTVTGIVSDVEGQPLAAVNVVIKGTTQGVSTDNDGAFSLQVTDNAILVFSYIGFLTQEIPTGTQRTINVTLVEDTQLIEFIIHNS